MKTILLFTENQTNRTLITGIHFMPLDDVHGLHCDEEELSQYGIVKAASDNAIEAFNIDNLSIYRELIGEPQTIEGKQPVVYGSYQTKEIWYEYENIPIQPPTKEEIQQELIDQLIVDNLNMQMQIDTLITSSL